MADEKNNSIESLVVFADKKIRRTWHKEEWWFVLEDIVQAVTDSRDPKQYINKMKQRDEPLAEGWVHIVRTLSIETSGGAQRMNCVNTQGGFRIVQCSEKQWRNTRNLRACKKKTFATI